VSTPPPATSSIPRAHYRFFAVGVAVLAAAGLLVTMRDRFTAPPDAVHTSGAVAPTDAIPQDALLVVTADLVRLRESGLAERLKAESRDVPGLGDIRKACGFDPFESFDTAAFAIPGGGADGDFGISVVGRAVGGAQLLACTTRVIEARGGKPLTSKLGSFEAVRDVGTGAPAGEIAARHGGPFLLGAGNYLRAMVDAADGRVASVRRDGAHARLASALGGAPVATATLVLGTRQRTTIAEEIARAEGSAPPAIGKVAAAAIGVETQGERVGLHAIVACDDARGALEVANALEALRLKPADSPLARLSGLASILAAIHVEVERDLVHARLVLPRKDAEVLVALLLGGARAPARPGGPAATPEVAPGASAPTSPSSSASAAPTTSAPASAGPSKKKKTPPSGPTREELEEF
jgi:hypothetical protein